MSETYIILSVPIGILCGLIGAYAMIKIQLRNISTELILPALDDILNEFMQNKEWQTKLYTAGGFLGAGIAQGSGLAGIVKKQPGGKLNFMDFLIGMGAQFLSGGGLKGMMGKAAETVTTQQGPQQQQSTNREKVEPLFR